MSEQGSRPLIVVGVDGSVSAIAALRWAAQQARLIDADIHAVTGWEVPITIMLVPTYTEADYARDARQVLDRAVAEALGPTPEVHVEKHLVQEHPALALCQAAETAQLLVVGSHKAALPGMHLGSVASYCVHHAPCPVVVIRGQQGRTPTS
ncbi:MAG: universal stress protein [Pseudonocardiaceae bacterium]